MADPTPARDLPKPAAIGLGLALSAFGVLLLALLQDQFGGLQPGSVHAPMPVLWAAALVFLCFGLGMLTMPFFRRLSGWLMLAAFLNFVGIFNWIAFGPGERQFSTRSSIGAGGVSHGSSRPASEGEGRFVFGLFAAGMDAVILYGLIAGLRRRKDSSDGARK